MELESILQKALRLENPSINESRFINDETCRLLSISNWNNLDIEKAEIIIHISDILYNNTSRTNLPLEDGVFDLLIEKYKSYRPYEIRSLTVNKDEKHLIKGITKESTEIKKGIVKVSEEISRNNLYINENELLHIVPITEKLLSLNKIIDGEYNNGKAYVNTEHNHPELVGTLDKCKFVTNKDAIEHGVFNDASVKVFERDFIDKHINEGIINPNEKLTLIAELKYDGVSIEADVTNKIISARTRGDTAENKAADLTHIFGGMEFPFAPEILANEEPIGMKFEAIITKNNLELLNRLRGTDYVNCRVAIIGLLGSSDAYKWRNFITLIPIESTIDCPRVVELEFLNKYYNMGEYNRYAVIETHSYNEIIYAIHRFQIEAEAMRNIIPYMYDGIVVSYADENIRKKLGREGAINKYSMAIKFNPLKKQTVFNGYSYTIGQNGVVTPLLHYLPVEFYGTIHTKSSGHSYARFKELSLREGDIIDVEYTNDVMPYATKSTSSINSQNQNPIIEFPNICPCCGSPLEFSDKTARCTNIDCPERIKTRVGSMMKKLYIKDFSEERLALLKVESFSDLIDLIKKKDIVCGILGEINGLKLLDRIYKLITEPVKDYIIFASIGFSNISSETWKKIFSKIDYQQFILLNDDELRVILPQIKGIGLSTIETLITEREYFKDDLTTTLAMDNIIRSSTEISKVIRFSGVRDQDLINQLSSINGIDISGDAGVTKSTNILIVPYEGYTSTKTSKVGPDTIIVPLAEFKNNINKYI